MYYMAHKIVSNVIKTKVLNFGLTNYCCAIFVH